MTLPATLPDVAAAILKLSDVFVAATVGPPGYIAVELDGGNGCWNLGTANGTWGGELEIFGGGIDRAVHTTLPPTHPNAVEIAEALFAAMAADSPWNSTVDDDPDPNDCAECARSFGPHYAGPCEHDGPKGGTK